MVSHVAELAFQRGLIATPQEAEGTPYAELQRVLAEDAGRLLAQAAAQDQVSLHSLVAGGKIAPDGQDAYALPNQANPDVPSVVRQALALKAIRPDEVALLFSEFSEYSCSGCQWTYTLRGQVFPGTLACLHCGAQAWLAGAVEAVDEDATLTDSAAGADAGAHTHPGALVGTTVGRWALTDLLGKGGVGAVYRAERDGPEGKVPAALKLILPKLDSDRSYQLRFRQEAEVTRSLEHPGIVRFLDYAEEPVPHLALELVDSSLSDYMNHKGRLSLGEALELASGVLDALVYAHGQKLVHRDLKPSNILLRGRTPVIADFGLGRLEADDDTQGPTRLTLTGQAMGTPHYMAPEQINDSKHVTPAADLYSVGAIVFALLAGQPPFTGPTAKAFLAHFKAKVPDVRMWCPDAPSAMVTLINDLMAKAPEARPTTQEAFDRLEAIRAKLPDPSPAAPPGPLGAINGWSLDAELRTSGAGRSYRCSRPSGAEANLLMLPSAVTPDDAAIKAFRRGIALLRREAHPNVGQIVEVGLVQRGDSRRLYVISDRPGDDLLTHLKQISALWPADAVAIAIGAARALAAAHAVGVTHRAVKPESILLVDGVVSSDAVRVVDFGAGFPPELSGGAQPTRSVLVPPHTLSPEQAAGEPVGPPADVYGLGATLFQLLTGSTLYAGPTATLLVAHATKLPDRADHRSGRVPRELGLILDLALLKQPDERPSMQEFLELLEAYAANTLAPKRLKTVRLKAETARRRFRETRSLSKGEL